MRDGTFLALGSVATLATVAVGTRRGSRASEGDEDRPGAPWRVSSPHGYEPLDPAGVLPVGTALFYGDLRRARSKVSRDGRLRVPEILTPNAEEAAHPEVRAFRFETTRAPRRLLLAPTYDDALLYLGGSRGRGVDAWRRMIWRMMRRAAAAQYDAVIIRPPRPAGSTRAPEVVVVAPDLLGPGTRVYPGVPRITGRRT